MIFTERLLLTKKKKNPPIIEKMTELSLLVKNIIMKDTVRFNYLLCGRSKLLHALTILSIKSWALIFVRKFLKKQFGCFSNTVCTNEHI